MANVHDRLHQALSEWQDILGRDRVLIEAEAHRRYGANTMAVRRSLPAALRPPSAQQLPALVHTARKYRIPLYPVSTGHNWGYGSALPVTDGSVLVDLSDLDSIIEMDAETGLVTLEPGVTQRMLRSYLDRNDLPYLVPVTGAGPDCSLVGNALERGYGITPYADHFAAVMSLEAVLPNGDIYRTPLSELGGTTVDHAFKWGVGPYLDGLFSQGNLGIVTRMTIALAPRPERIEGFFFGIEKDSDLEETVNCIRNALRQTGPVSGSINLMNRRRVLSMMAPYPFGQENPDGILPTELLQQMAKQHQVMEWMGAGALYGNARLVRAARSVIRKELRPVARRLLFFTPSKVERIRRSASVLPGRLGRQTARIFDTLGQTLRLLAGSPSEIALPLAYWKSGRKPQGNAPLNPARDGCGLIWYSPLVPMRPAQVRTYTELVTNVCSRHGIEPLITLTTLSDRCFDSTVPILFNPENPEETKRAHACYDELFERGQKEGFLPYRANISSMERFTSESSTFWRLARDIKKTVDEHNILAPGRYSLL